MGSVVIDMSMSLDGYIAAPNDNPEQGLGEDGMRLHDWAFDDPSVFEQVYGDLTENTGAVIMGRRSYDNSIENWGGKSRTTSSAAAAASTGRAPTVDPLRPSDRSRAGAVTARAGPV